MSGRRTIGIVAVVVFAAALLVVARHFRNKPRAYSLTGAVLADYSSLEPIDAHTHVFQASSELTESLRRLHVHVLDILYVDNTTANLKSLDVERAGALAFVQSSSANARLCTTFDPFAFGKELFVPQAIKGLDGDFQQGAVAVKIWKNVGMELTDSSGKYILPDDRGFQAILQDIAANNKTLIVHAADPDEAWQEKRSGPPFTYYTSNPQWDMTKNPGAPAKGTILQARDRLLAANPGVRVIGAHLGSMENQIDQLAGHLDRYPNFAVDTAGRVRRLVVQPRDKVREFVLKYQDRILYGTDLHLYAGTESPAAVARSWEEQYALDWRYFSTGDKFTYQGHEVQGLNLPRTVLKKLYHDNAVHWIPGVLGPNAQ